MKNIRLHPISGQTTCLLILASLFCSCATSREIKAARNQTNRGNPDIALRHLLAVKNEVIQGNKTLWGDYTGTLNETIQVAEKNQDPGTLIDAYKLQLELYQSTPSATESLQMVSRRAAVAANQLGCQEDALTFLRSGLTARQGETSTADKVYQFYLLGMQYEALGDLDVAMRYGKSAIDLSNETALRNSYINVCLNVWYANMVLNSGLYKQEDTPLLQELLTISITRCEKYTQTKSSSPLISFYRKQQLRAIALKGLLLARNNQNGEYNEELGSICPTLQSSPDDICFAPFFFEVDRVADAARIIDNLIINSLSSDAPGEFVGGLSPLQTAQMICLRARIAAIEGDYAGTAKYINMGLDFCNGRRMRIQSPTARASFSTLIETLCNTVVSEKQCLTNHALLYKAMESAKSRLFLDILYSQKRSAGNDNPKVAELLDLRDQIQRLSYAANNSELQYAYRGMKAVASDNKTAQSSPLLHELKSKYSHLVSELRREGLETLASGSGTICDISDVQKRLGKNEVILSYYLSGDQLTILALRNDTAYATTVPCNEDELRIRISSLLKQIETGPPASSTQLKRACDELSKSILAPVENFIKDQERIILCPHKSLHRLPFCILRNRNGEYWMESQELQYAMSCSTLVSEKNSHATTNTKTKQIAAFGSPENSRWPELPASKTELIKSQQYLPEIKLFLGSDFNKENFIQQIRKENDLVISTHTTEDEDSPLLSKIILSCSTTNPEDGYITSDDICSQRMPDSNVFLNSCNSGQVQGLSGSDIPAGDEYFGLPQAFLVAGAKNVTCTLWPLNDRYAAQFGIEYHKMIATETNTSSAPYILRKTQTGLYTEFSGIPVSAWAGYKMFTSHL